MTEQQDVFETIAKQVAKYLAGSASLDVHVTDAEAPALLERRLDLSLPIRGLGLEELPAVVHELLSGSVKTASPRFLNQLFGAASLPGILGDLLGAATNASLYTYEAAPVATLVERALVQEICTRLSFGDGEGIFVTGGSNANHVAMLMARNQAWPDAVQAGVHRGPRLVAFVSEDAHYSFEIGARLIGIGDTALEKVPTDDGGRMCASALKESVEAALARGDKPFFVGATAGTTVRGVFDPIRTLHEVTHAHGLWLHVDGAWGGAVFLSPKSRHLLDGIELADSFCWDAHKLLGMPLVCSLLLTRARGHLERTHGQTSSDYLFHDDEMDLGRKSLQCGRRADAFKLWLAWKVNGAEGLADQVDRLMELARLVGQWITEQPSLELLGEVPFANVCFRVRGEDDAFQVRVREILKASGRALVNHARVNGRRCLRLIIANHVADETSLRTFVDDVLWATQMATQERHGSTA